jgi:hypothetical protein
MDTQQIEEFKKELNIMVESNNRAIDITKRQRLCNEIKEKIKSVLSHNGNIYGDIICQDADDNHFVKNDYLYFYNNTFHYISESLDLETLADYFKDNKGLEIDRDNITEVINNNSIAEAINTTDVTEEYECIDKNYFVMDNLSDVIEHLIKGENDMDKMTEHIKDIILTIQKDKEETEYEQA